MDITFKTPGELLNDLGNLIRAHRLDRNLTQQAMAAKAGVGRNAIVKLERGDPVTTETLMRVLNAIDAANSISALLPQPKISPINLMHHKPERRRVRVPRRPPP